MLGFVSINVLKGLWQDRGIFLISTKRQEKNSWLRVKRIY
jgi:hypothetical protein